MRLAGWACYTTFLSGTTLPGKTMAETVAKGGVYILVHMMAWVLSPVFMIAALLAWLWGRGEIKGEDTRCVVYVHRKPEDPLFRLLPNLENGL
jgi:hypothetical protein